MDEQNEGLARLTDLDMTWGFDLHTFLRERSQETPAAGGAGDGTVETMDSSQGGAVDASSVPAGRAETVETMDSSRDRAVDAFSIPAGRNETVETIGSSKRGKVDASSVPARRAESDSGASAASGTDQGNGDDPLAILSGRQLTSSAAGDGYPQQYGAGPKVRANASRVSLLNGSVRRDVCSSANVDGGWEYTRECILDDGGRNGHDGWRTCCGRK